ncbi:MAG: DNA repair protein RadC [Candidatus Omnitrophota bacterium]
MKYTCKTSIKKWPKDERPRERLFKYGEHTLTNAELLAILFRTGAVGLDAVGLGRQVMSYFKTLRNMNHVDVRELRKFKGMGDAKIAQLKASFEIARRFMCERKEGSDVIKSPKDAADLLMPRLRDLKKEVFQVLLLDSRNHVIDIIEIEEGTVDAASPQIREICVKALQKFAVSVIAAHNHPSGEPEPSKEDAVFTENLVTAGNALQLNVLDHLIIGDNKYYSFAEHKRL